MLVAEYGPDVPVPEEAPLPPRQRPRAPVDDGVGDAAADPDDAAASAETSVPSAEPSGTADEAAELDADGDAPPVPTRPFDREEQRARLQSAERKLAQLGRVNPLALEEFAALEQRHLFLTEQLADLTATRKDLLTIIDDIDRTMQGVFAAAFEDTRAAFDRVFPILFPGGTGSIHLTDPEQLLTTGIEVSVRPAGKRIERLSLLSGGERSLAAVALLIAIFTARPSPFYIMDEVEAALDDANLGRLLTILEQLRDTSQLIVITHQKRTMEIADALYGVSMRQDGVSAVVGQRVSRDARPDPAPASAGEDEPDGAPATEQEPAPRSRPPPDPRLRWAHGSPHPWSLSGALRGMFAKPTIDETTWDDLGPRSSPRTSAPTSPRPPSTTSARRSSATARPTRATSSACSARASRSAWRSTTPR